MTTSRSDSWDRFWGDRMDQPPSAIEPESWEAMVWAVALDFWEGLFGRLAPGRQMLECGCGSAKVSLHLSERGYRCTMVDYSDRALLMARARFAESHASGTFLRCDVNALSFPDDSFDIVHSGGMLEFFGDVRRPIAEMARVLRPGGVFSASMVPRKWSIQSVGDLERTAVRSVKRVATGRINEAFRMVRGVPDDYQVNPARLDDYVAACREAGLVSVVGRAVTPFPALALPRAGRVLYGRALKKLRPGWERFDRSPSRWTELVGMAYRIYGVKAR